MLAPLARRWPADGGCSAEEQDRDILLQESLLEVSAAAMSVVLANRAQDDPTDGRFGLLSPSSERAWRPDFTVPQPPTTLNCDARAPALEFVARHRRDRLVYMYILQQFWNAAVAIENRRTSVIA